MSLIRTRDRSTNYETNRFQLRPTASIGAWPAAPLYVDIGTAATSTAASNISWPGGSGSTQAGDLGILVVQSNGDDATVTSSGWTHFPGSPVVDIADITGSKLNVLYKFADAFSPAVAAIPDVGDHFVGRIVVFRNVTANPATFATATSTKTTASTSVSWPSLTTRCPNSRIVLIASRPDDSSSTSVFSGYTNTNLTSITEAGEAGTVSGTGGGFTIAHATMATLGDIGVTTGTLSVSVTNCSFVIALEPSTALLA